MLPRLLRQFSGHASVELCGPTWLRLCQGKPAHGAAFLVLMQPSLSLKEKPTCPASSLLLQAPEGNL